MGDPDAPPGTGSLREQVPTELVQRLLSCVRATGGLHRDHAGAFHRRGADHLPDLDRERRRGRVRPGTSRAAGVGGAPRCRAGTDPRPHPSCGLRSTGRADGPAAARGRQGALRRVPRGGGRGGVRPLHLAHGAEGARAANKAGTGPGRHAGLRAAAPEGGRRTGHVVELPGGVRLVRRIRRSGRRERARAPSRRAVRALRDVGPRPGCRGGAARGPVADRAGSRSHDRHGCGGSGRRRRLHRLNRCGSDDRRANRSEARLHVLGARREEPVHRAGRRGPRPGGRGRDPSVLHQRRPDLRRPRADPGPARRLRDVPRQAGRRGSSASGWAGSSASTSIWAA